MKPEEDIHQLLQRRENAIMSGDADAALRLLAADVEVYDLPPPLRTQGDAARDPDALKAWFDTWNGPVQSTLSAPTILVDGDLAVVFGLLRIRGDKKGVGPTEVWTRSTSVLQRREGHWQVVHEHLSVPMHMDGSDKAAVDLKP
jgi:ketosteroid isomerase-like protein